MLRRFIRRQGGREKDYKPRCSRWVADRWVTHRQPPECLKDAEPDVERAEPPKDAEARTLFFGSHRLPPGEETNYALPLGGTRSARSSILADIQMRHVLSRIVTPLGNERVGAVIYDRRGHLLPMITDLVGAERVLILNPFHEDGVAPNMACMSQADRWISQLLNDCIGERPDDAVGPFWRMAAGQLLTAVTRVLEERAPGCWTLRDVIEAASSTARLRFVLRQSERTRLYVQSYLGVGRTAENIVSYIQTSLGDLRSLAAAWEALPRTLDLKRFVTELGAVLVLQPSWENRLASEAALKFFMEPILQEALALDDSKERRLFFFLDEVQELGRTSLLPEAIRRGRSRGLAFFIHTQCLESLRRVYSEEDVWQIVNSGSRALDLLLCDKTAAEGREAGVGQNEFAATIKPPSRGVLLDWVDRRARRLTRRGTSMPSLFDRDCLAPPKAGPDVAAFVLREDDWRVLKPWTSDDIPRLRLHLAEDDDVRAVFGATEAAPPPPCITEDDITEDPPRLNGKPGGTNNAPTT